MRRQPWPLSIGHQELDATRREKISVIIPTFNEEASLPRTLAQFQHLSGNWQVIVVDSRSTDQTVQVAREHGVGVVIDAPPGRGLAMNAGAREATGEVLLFLHADTLLPANAYQLILDGLASPGVSATGFRYRADRSEWRYRILTLVGAVRFRIQRTFFGDQAMAMWKRDFAKVRGYHEPTLMEDIDLSRRLRECGELRLLPAYVTTSARRFEQGGVIRTLALMTALSIAYSAGVSAERLSLWYRHIRADRERGNIDPERIDLSGVELIDEQGHPVQLSSVAPGNSVLLVFLRWLG